MVDLIRIERDVAIPMQDMILLRCDIYRPGNAGKYPAIVMRSPYHIDGLFHFGYVQVMPTIQAGYALVFAYVRGRLGSEGKYDSAAPQEIEGPDCYDTIEWVASQPWCDGNTEWL